MVAMGLRAPRRRRRRLFVTKTERPFWGDKRPALLVRSPRAVAMDMNNVDDVGDTLGTDVGGRGSACRGRLRCTVVRADGRKAAQSGLQPGPRRRRRPRPTHRGWGHGWASMDAAEVAMPSPRRRLFGWNGHGEWPFPILCREKVSDPIPT